MKKSKKAFRSTIYGGYKGKVVIQKTTLSLRKALVSNMAAVRAALRHQRENTSDDTPISPLTPQAVVSNDNSWTSISSLSSERSHYKKRGSAFDKFMDDGKDWRSFGSYTFNGMMNDGYFSILMKKISIYKNARTNKARHKAVICSSELPLSEAASRLLDTKMRVA